MDKESRHIFIDPTRCTGCRLCELACSMEHHGILSTHRSRIKVIAFHNPTQYQPVICQACYDAPCIKVCPVNARIRQANQSVTTDNEKCIGCRACLYICHLASPTINPNTGQTMTCDLCAGDDTGPWCVSACRSDQALQWTHSDVYAREAARLQASRSLANRREQPKPAHGAPRVNPRSPLHDPHTPEASVRSSARLERRHCAEADDGSIPARVNKGYRAKADEGRCP